MDKTVIVTPRSSPASVSQRIEFTSRQLLAGRKEGIRIRRPGLESCGIKAPIYAIVLAMISRKRVKGEKKRDDSK